MSMFILSQNGKVGVYGIGDRVIGSAGTEKALIMDGATNTIVDNTVEEIHLQNNIENLSFAVDENTNTVSILNGNSVVASFAANENGIKLFTANGMSVIKMALDEVSGDVSFTADNGSASATPVALPTNGTALPAEAIDANGKSDNAGGNTPVPPVTEEGILVADAAAGLANGTYKGGDYILDDSVANLNIATYAVVNGAKSITVADTVKNLKADDAANALALASNVSVEDGLKNLALNDPFDFGGKPTTLVVTSAPVSNSVVKLGEVSVAEAAGAQAKIDAFLAKTTGVTYADGVKKPDALIAGDYSIVDNAANLISADGDLLVGGNNVTVKDTIAEIAKIPTATFASVDTVSVSDSLANITQADSALLAQIAAKTGSTFVATDTTEATAFIDGSFDGTTGKTIDLSNLVNDNASLTIQLEDASSSGIDFISKNPFGKTLSSKVDLSIVGTDNPDTITLATDLTTSGKFISNDARIDGGLGADNITLGKGADVVVLGTDITNKEGQAYGYGSDANSAANNDSIASFNVSATASGGIDKLEFADFLDGFDKGDFMTLGTAAKGISGADFNGKIIQLTATADFDKVSALFDADKGIGEGNAMIVIASDNTNTNIWYVADTQTDGTIAADEIHLVATLAGVKEQLTADNIA